MSCSRGNLKDKNDEKNADSGSLAHDVAEESKGSAEMRKRGYFIKGSVCTDHLGLRNPRNSGENFMLLWGNRKLLFPGSLHSTCGSREPKLHLYM